MDEADPSVVALGLVSEEIESLEGLLRDGNLYKTVKALYHKPSDLEEICKQQDYHDKVFGAKLKRVLQARRRKAWKSNEELRAEYKQAWEAWRRRVRREEIRNGEQHEEPTSTSQHPPGSQKQHPTLLQNANPRAGNAAANAAGFGIGGGSRSRSRSSLAGDVVRSEAELNLVLLTLLEQDREDPTMRWMSTLAFVPPMLSSPDCYSMFIDENGKIPPPMDPLNPSEDLCMPTTAFLSPHGFANTAVWSAEEERVFVERFLHYPKDFAKISSGFLASRGKRTGDCVQFYYRNKKRLGLGQKLAAFKRNPSISAIMKGAPSMAMPSSTVTLSATIASNQSMANLGSGQGKKRVGRPPRNPHPPPLTLPPPSMLLRQQTMETTVFDSIREVAEEDIDDEPEEQEMMGSTNLNEEVEESLEQQDEGEEAEVEMEE